MTKKISSNQLFFLIFVSRVVVCLTYVQAISVGKVSGDLIISFIIAFFLTALFSLPIIICIKKGINPLKNKTIRAIYSLYYLLCSAITVSRFSYFATTKMNPQMSMIVLIIISFVAICYGAVLGVEALGRFASFCGVLLLIATTAVLICDFNNFDCLNLYPVFVNSKSEFIQNAFLFMSNSIEPALLLAISNHVNKSAVKPYYIGLFLSFLVILLSLVFTVGTLGGNASLQSFPIFALFQMASVSDFSRLDMLHTSFWVLGMFLKSAILIYAASKFTSKLSHKTRTILVSILAFLMSVFINFVLGTNVVNVSKYITIISFVVLVVILPIIYYFFRRNKIEKD